MQLYPSLHLKLRNCEIAAAGAGSKIYSDEARMLMEGPNTANLDALAQSGLVFVPMPENVILDYAHELFARWERNFREGLIVVHEPWASPAPIDAPEGRSWQVKFASADHFANAGMIGRFFVWLDRPYVFFVNDFCDFSGIACPPGLLRNVFRKSLGDFLSEFEGYAEQCSLEQGGEYFRKLANLYSSQIG